MRWFAAAVAVVLLASGCGGSPAAPPESSTTAPAGKALFVRNCGACHGLAAADASGGVGGDLDELRPSGAVVVSAIADGPGLMPPNLVTGSDARLIARYVAQVAGRS